MFNLIFIYAHLYIYKYEILFISAYVKIGSACIK